MSTPEPGQIVVDEAGNVTIGLPTAVAVAVAPLPVDAPADEQEEGE